MAGYRPDSQKLSKNNPRDRLRSEADLDFGIYVGEVIVRPKDETHTGRIPVYIPMLGKDRDDPSGYYNCYWTSPFAGSTPSAKLGNNIASYADAQKSYGMWMVPPDAGNFVLVAFADGKKKFPVIVSCLFPDQLQFMVPGNASSATFGTEIPSPTAEKNKREDNPSHAFSSQRPINPYVVKPLLDQGLLLDPVRGTTTSSARRESPSEVFGILTPGADQFTDDGKINGTNRLAGHSFVLDDNMAQRHIRLRTGGGAQLLMDDTNEIIYIINQRGTSWIEMNANGDIHAYSGGKFNVRALNDINLHSDSNINLNANMSVNINAGNIAESYGNIKMEGGAKIEMLSGTGGTFFQTKSNENHLVDGSIFHQAGASIHSLSGAETMITSGGDLHLYSGGTVNSQAASRNNVLGSTVHLNDGGTAVSAQGAANITPFTQLNYYEPPGNPIKFKYDVNNPNPADDPFPDGGNGAGVRPGTNANINSIVTELTTREPWYLHTKEVAATGISTDITESQDAPANTKPGSITGETEPRFQPAPGYPGQIVDAQTPSSFIAPDGTPLPLSTAASDLPPTSTVKWSVLNPSPGTAQLQSAAGLGSPLGTTNNIGDSTDKLGEVMAGIIQTTPTASTIGYPFGTDPQGNPVVKQLGTVIGKNHLCSPSELKMGAIVQGIPGKESPTGFPIGIDPSTKLNFDGIGTLDKILEAADLENNGAAGLVQFGAVQLGNTNAYKLTDTKDPTKYVIVQALSEPIDDVTATQFLKSDLQNTRISLGKSLQRAPGMSTGQFLGLTSFAHSIGYTNWLRSGARDAILSGDQSKAVYNMMKWTRLYQRIVKPELQARRKAEAAMFCCMDYQIPQITRLVDSGGTSVGSWLQLYNRIGSKPN